MSQANLLRHEFVEFVPSGLEDGVIYVSIEYSTVAHRCCCGCGREVITPLSPTDWKLIFDGRTVTLYPSIGNWDYPCRSHYWIRNSRAEWALPWSQAEIDAGRDADARAKAMYYQGNLSIPALSLRESALPAKTATTDMHNLETPEDRKSFWCQLKQWFGG
jgi:hypothetical protein